MLSDIVDQKAIIAIRPGKKSFQKSPVQPPKAFGRASASPRPPAAMTRPTASRTETAIRNGADQFSKMRSASMPFRMM